MKDFVGIINPGLIYSSQDIRGHACLDSFVHEINFHRKRYRETFFVSGQKQKGLRDRECIYEVDRWGGGETNRFPLETNHLATGGRDNEFLSSSTLSVSTQKDSSKKGGGGRKKTSTDAT